MGLTWQYKDGDTLDQSFVVATDEKGEYRVARATHVLPQSLHKAASANRLTVGPEYFIDYLKMLCHDLDSFESVVAKLASGDQVIEVSAAKGDAPVSATEPVSVPKHQDKPEVSTESPLTLEPKGKGGSREVAQYYSGLVGHKDSGPEQAVDVQSADKDAKIQALSEEVQKKDEEISGLKGEIDSKKKDDELKEIVDVLQAQKVDAKEIDKIKKDLSGLPEKAIGAIEHILRLVCKTKAAEESKGKSEDKGKPDFLKATSDDSLAMEASNILGTTELVANKVQDFSSAWILEDMRKEAR